MERKKLLQEYKDTLNSLVEKTKFVYSEKFYKLSDLDRQKYTKDKMATEGHLGTLCNLLWGNTQTPSSITDFFALGIISSMLGSPFGYQNNTTVQAEKLDEKDFAVPEN